MTDGQDDTAAGSKGGVAAVDRALAILAAFREDDRGVTLAELAKRTGLYKSTILRLLESLEAHHYVTRGATGQYTLGSRIAYLNEVYERSQSLGIAIEPFLKGLAEATRESASFEIREGDARVVLARVDGAQRMREHMIVGSRLPLHAGAAGHVITRFEDGPGRARGDELLVNSFGERNSEAAAVSAPVFRADGRLAGALCVSGTLERFRDAGHIALVRDEVLRASRAATRTLGGQAAAFDAP